MKFQRRMFLVLILTLGMMFCSGLTVFAEVGPGVQDGVDSNNEGRTGDLPIVDVRDVDFASVYAPPYEFIWPEYMGEQYCLDAYPTGRGVLPVSKDATTIEMLRLCQNEPDGVISPLTNDGPTLASGQTYCLGAKMPVPANINSNDSSWVIRMDSYLRVGLGGAMSISSDYCLGGPGNMMYTTQGGFISALFDEDRDMRSAKVDIDEWYLGYVDVRSLSDTDAAVAITNERTMLEGSMSMSAEIVHVIPTPDSGLLQQDQYLLHMNVYIRGASLRPGQMLYVVYKFDL